MPAPLPDWPPLAAARLVKVLPAGPLSQSRIVELAGKLYVLRIDKPAAAKIVPMRSGESAVLQAIAGSQIGPALLASDPARGLQLVEYLGGTPLTADDLADSGRIVQLASLLARLHCLEVAEGPALPVLDLPAAARRYAQVAADASALRDAAFVGQQVPGLMASAGPLVLAHNDIHPGNLVDCGSGSLRAIDWEYGALGPREFELAVFMEQGSLSPLFRQLLVRAYVDSSGPLQLETLPAWREVYRRVDHLWRRAVERLVA